MRHQVLTRTVIPVPVSRENCRIQQRAPVAEPTTLTKSRFKVALECPRKLAYAADRRYVNAKSEDGWLEALAEGGHQVGALAKLMHPGGIEISATSTEEQIRETERLLQEEEITLFEPTFRYENLVVRVDVLVKRGREVQLRGEGQRA